jgi:hypothetical protein
MKNVGAPRLPSRSRWLLQVTIAFGLLQPAVMCVLLILKGLLPDALEHPFQFCAYVYRAGAPIAFLAGLFLALGLWKIRHRWTFCIRPYDFGRSFSVGAIGGAAFEVVSILLFQIVIPRPLPAFRFATEVLASCAAGALVMAIAFWRMASIDARSYFSRPGE